MSARNLFNFCLFILHFAIPPPVSHAFSLFIFLVPLLWDLLLLVLVLLTWLYLLILALPLVIAESYHSSSPHFVMFLLSVILFDLCQRHSKYQNILSLWPRVFKMNLKTNFSLTLHCIFLFKNTKVPLVQGLIHSK